MLTWNKKFETGSVLIDSQHRMLIDKINELEQVVSGASVSKAKCDDLLNFLGSYAASHFKFEEGCMQRYRCPAHEQNAQAHAAFMGVFGKFKEQYEVQGPKVELLKNLQVTATEWISSHILSVDVRLNSCLKP
ncbi:MAG TPA: hemerythrin family protein [Verrucomicrobiae bacterium]|nr:hemerythrin family protein [Verrucomicrobiae bacterium]